MTTSSTLGQGRARQNKLDIVKVEGRSDIDAAVLFSGAVWGVARAPFPVFSIDNLLNSEYIEPSQRTRAAVGMLNAGRESNWKGYMNIVARRGAAREEDCRLRGDKSAA